MSCWLKKNYSKNGRTCRITFKYPNDEKGTTAVLSGDFNNWNFKSHPMKCLKDGSFSVTLTIDTNRSYRFRYVVDGKNWQNDHEADSYIANGYGCDDSVISV